MASFTLGSDVYLEFQVKVAGKLARINSTSGELYHGDKFMREFVTRNTDGKVSGQIDGKTFSTIGDYVAKFNVFLSGRGKEEHAIPFKITKSVLGKKRVIR